MKLYRNILIASLGMLLLSGCSENGDAAFKDGETIISLVGVKCVTGTPTDTDISNYETLQAGDTIVKDDDNATVIIYHDVTGTKKICLVDNGSSAHIVR